jgi:hypothetical protein
MSGLHNLSSVSLAEAVLVLDTLTRVLRADPGFSAMSCSGPLHSALGNAERLIERWGHELDG